LEIEERFLAARADPFARANAKEKASARSAWNDSVRSRGALELVGRFGEREVDGDGWVVGDAVGGGGV
jgi:hypothetical protein